MNDETYRLADPFTCLVCGAPSPSGWHHCAGPQCVPGAWGDRFTGTFTSATRDASILAIATGLGSSISHATEEFELLKDHASKYDDIANRFYKALFAFADALTEGVVGPGHSCPACQSLPEIPADPVGAAWALAPRAACPVAELHIAKVLLSVKEDWRHGLAPGSTMKEADRVAREQQLRRKVDAVSGRDLAGIVTSSLEGR